MTVQIAGIRAGLEILERGLNIVGYIPVVGSIGAYTRGTLATLQIITGIALAILSIGMGGTGALLCWQFGTALVGHSILNGLRCMVEYPPCVALVTTLPYDIISLVVIGGRLFPYI